MWVRGYGEGCRSVTLSHSSLRNPVKIKPVFDRPWGAALTRSFKMMCNSRAPLRCSFVSRRTTGREGVWGCRSVEGKEADPAGRGGAGA